MDNMHDNTLSQPGAAASGDLSTVPYHMADVGTDNFEHEFTLGLIENEEEELREIDAALERLEKGTFGSLRSLQETDPQVPAQDHPLRQALHRMQARRGTRAAPSHPLREAGNPFMAADRPLNGKAVTAALFVSTASFVLIARPADKVPGVRPL